jgi:hypothetical protein
VLRPASASAVHRRMLIGRSSQSQPALPGPRRRGPDVALPAPPDPRLRPAGPRPGRSPPCGELPCRYLHSRLPKILGKAAGPKRSRHPQRPRKRPASLRFVEASLAEMQVGTPARAPGQCVRNDLVPGGHQPKQVGLGRTGPTSHTRPDR